METTKLIEVSIDQVQIGDVICISTKDNAPRYQVLDMGKPFILIENLSTHFASLWRAQRIYKPLIVNEDGN